MSGDDKKFSAPQAVGAKRSVRLIIVRPDHRNSGFSLRNKRIENEKNSNYGGGDLIGASGLCERWIRRLKTA
jgi:hypothetical protein